MSKPTVWRWWDRFLVEGVDGPLYDIPRRRGRKPISEEKISELIALAMSPPPEHASHWTLRALAKKVGIAVSTVFGILKSHGLKPHRVRTFKVSRDPRFELRSATSSASTSTRPTMLWSSRWTRRHGSRLWDGRRNPRR